jgi:hypothetical protein
MIKNTKGFLLIKKFFLKINYLFWIKNFYFEIKTFVLELKILFWNKNYLFFLSK